MGVLVDGIDALWTHAARSRDPDDDVVAAAVFDADHTLWHGDIGDLAFVAAADAGMIRATTWQGPIRAWATSWDLALPDEPRAGVRAIVDAVTSGALDATARARGLTDAAWKASLYGMQAWAYAGCRRSDVQALGERLFADGFAARIYDDMRAVIARLRDDGVDVWIASASHAALVLPGAQRLGIPDARVLGMEPVVDDNGITQAAIAQDTFGPGKATTVQRALGDKRPLWAFGDSVLSTDKELLALADRSVGVATTGAHRQAALAHPSMLLFDPTPPTARAAPIAARTGG